jgi:transposase InsO family protein
VPGAEPPPKPPFEPDINPQLTAAQRAAMDKMLRSIPEAFARDSNKQPAPAPGIEHEIHLSDDKPVKQAAYRHPPAKKEEIKKVMEKLLAQQVVQPSSSPWSSPVVLAKKPNGAWRFCIDYRKLNAKTRKDAYPIPLIEDCLNFCGRAKWLSIIDIKDAYWHVPMAKKSQPLTAFVTPEGLFEWLRMPFGLCNAPATFQRLVDYCLRGLIGKDCIAFFDDCLVFGGETFEEHMAAVERVLRRLAEHGLEANIKKSRFGYTEVQFVGHIVSQGTVRPNPEKLKAVSEFPVPINVTGVKSFLGLVNYYHKFIPGAALLAAPLYALTRKGRAFEWTAAAQTAFIKLKEALLSAPCLYAPDFKRPFILQTDASGDGISAVLVQQFDDGEHPIAYVSRQLNKAEKNYAATEWECLAVVWGIGQFESYLIGAPFTIVTDHSALVWLPSKRFDNARLTRWALKLQEFTYNIVHRPGKANANADALSRFPVPGSARAEEGAINDDGLIRDPEDQPRFIRRVTKWRTKLEQLPERRVFVPEAESSALYPRVVRVSLAHKLPFANCETPASHQAARTIIVQVRGAAAAAAQPNDRPPADSDLTVVDEAALAGAFVDAQHMDSPSKEIILYLTNKEIPQHFDEARRKAFPSYCSHYTMLPIKTSTPTRHQQALYYYPVRPRHGLAALVPLQPRLVVPAGVHRDAILSMMHDSPFGGHFGVKRTLARLSARYYWNTLLKDVTQWVASCPRCQQEKIQHRQQSARQGHIRPPSRPFELLSADHIGPLPESPVDHFRHALIVIDHFTGWAIAIPTTTTTAGNTARALVEEVFLRYGYPQRLLSDRGSAFRNELMAAICKDSHVKALFTTAEHPQANGKVERLNGTLKQIIKTCSDVFGDHWPDALQFAVFAYNTSRSTTTGYTPYYLLYGFEASSPASSIADSLEADSDSVSRPAYADIIKHNQQSARAFVESVLQDKKRLVELDNAALARVPSYRVGDKVWLNRSGLSTKEPPFSGPWLVAARLGETTYRLDPIRSPSRPATLRMRPTTVHVTRLKPFQSRDPIIPDASTILHRTSPQEEPYELPTTGIRAQAAPPAPPSKNVLKKPISKPTSSPHVPSHPPPPIVVPTEPVKPALPQSPAASVLSRRRQGWRLNYDEKALIPDAPRPSSRSSHSRSHKASTTSASAAVKTSKQGRV